MEYLEGESLRNMLCRLKSMPAIPAADLLIQVCRGLDYAHSQGIVHRDINPFNLLVQPNNRLKVIDFGLACPIGTDDMNMGGALPYLAPELLDGEPANQQSDIYALGITAYEMVTGVRPYPEDSAGALMKIRRTQDIPDPASKKPDLPDALRRVILKACRRDPQQRYRNMSQMAEELEAVTTATSSR